MTFRGWSLKPGILKQFCLGGDCDLLWGSPFVEKSSGEKQLRYEKQTLTCLDGPVPDDAVMHYSPIALSH